MGNVKKVTFAVDLEVIMGPPERTTDSEAVQMGTGKLASVSEMEDDDGDGSSAVSCNGADMLPTEDQYQDAYASYIPYWEIGGQVGRIDGDSTDSWDSEGVGVIETRTNGTLRQQMLAEEVVLVFSRDEKAAPHSRRNGGSTCLAGITFEESILQDWLRVRPAHLHQNGRRKS